MSDKFREEWEHPDHPIRRWFCDGWWIYEHLPRTIRADHQTKAEYDALMVAEPKKGDMIEVRDRDSDWIEREFLAFDGEGRAVVRSGAFFYHAWAQWRPITTPTTISVDEMKRRARLV